MLLTGGVWRVAPLRGEMTQSFLRRVAARYGVGLRDLLAAIAEVGGLSNVTGQTRVDSEVYLNRQARDRVSQLCRVPEDHLRRALPAWAQEEPRKRFAAGPAAQFHHTAEKVVPWGPACPECSARSAGRAEGARLYLEPQQRVCVLHRRWLMQVPGTAGRVVELPAGGGQWVQAHRRHTRLLRRSSVAVEAFEVAAAVTASWWWKAWPREHVWPSRLRSLGSGRMDPEAWWVLARELVTYPETVALATLLADDGFRRCLTADARGHVPFRLADLPVLLSAVARCVGRLWYGEQLADETSGPLFAWAYQCVRPLRRTGWLCISVRESFRGDDGSHLLTEFAMSVCFDVAAGLAVGRWIVLLPLGAVWERRSRRSICTQRSAVTIKGACRSGRCSASTTSPGGPYGERWMASGRSLAGSIGAVSRGWILTSR